MKEHNYSPYAVIAEFNNNGWPTETRICEKTLYIYIYEGVIPGVSEEDLQMKGKGRKQVKCKRNHKNAALAPKSIAYRPKRISTREEFGHWEGDTVVGGKCKGSECLLTITERKTRAEIARKLPDKSAKSVVHAFETIERELGTGNFKRLFKSITFDNGTEFQDISGIEKSAFGKKNKTTIYLTHPYCASERNTNERHNEIIRRFIPKGCLVKEYSKSRIKNIQRTG